MCLHKKISHKVVTQYFYGMKKWIPLLLTALLFACTNTKDKAPDSLEKDEMPAHVRKLFRQTEERPDSIGLRMQLVDALDSIGAYRQAMGQMDSLIKKDSLNYAFWYRKALVQQKGGDTTGALGSFRNAITIYPSPDAVLAAANLFAEKKDSTALSLLRSIADMRLGGVYDAHLAFIGAVYFARTGDKKRAMEGFDYCISKSHTYMEAYMEKGFLYYDDKKTAQAAQIFQTAIRVLPIYADAYYWLAKCQELMNNKTEAITNYQMAVKFDPAIKEAHEALKRLGVK